MCRLRPGRQTYQLYSVGMRASDRLRINTQSTTKKPPIYHRVETITRPLHSALPLSPVSHARHAHAALHPGRAGLPRQIGSTGSFLCGPLGRAMKLLCHWCSESTGHRLDPVIATEVVGQAYRQTNTRHCRVWLGESWTFGHQVVVLAVKWSQLRFTCWRERCLFGRWDHIWRLAVEKTARLA